MMMNDPAEIIVRVHKNVGRITLNRPKALHALTLGMCEKMIDTLVEWQADPEIDMVMIDHTGERGFCAGGDIRMLADSGAGDGVAARQFFHTEYRLNHLLFHYDRPIVAIMDGHRHGRRGRHLDAGPLPDRHRAHDLRHARDRHWPFPRRRRRLVSAAPAGQGGAVAGPDRGADQGRGLPAPGHRHPLCRVRRDRGPEEGHHRRSSPHR